MPKQKRDKTITICLNANDFKLLDGASKLLSRPLSIFIRSNAVEEARRVLSDPELHERELNKSQEEYFGS